MLDRELFDLLEGTSDAAFTVTDQGEICSWKKAAERLFGYSKAEVLQKSCQELLQGRGALAPECVAIIAASWTVPQDISTSQL